MTTPTDPYAMVQAGSSEWRALRALGWRATDVQPGAHAAEGDWHHMEPPLGGSQIYITTEEPPKPAVEEPSGLVWREPVTVGPHDVLLVTAPDCTAENVSELRQEILDAREHPEGVVTANFDIFAQVVRFEQSGPPRLRNPHAPAKVLSLDLGPTSTDPPPPLLETHTPAKVLRLDHQRKTVTFEVADPTTPHQAEWSWDALACEDIEMGQEVVLSTTIRATEWCAQCRNPDHDGLCTCGGCR